LEKRGEEKSVEGKEKKNEKEKRKKKKRKETSKHMPQYSFSISFQFLPQFNKLLQLPLILAMKFSLVNVIAFYLITIP